MKLFGITGGVGMGKSTTGQLLEKQGIAVVDTDRIARQLVEPNQPALAEIAAAFGSSLVLADGQLDRKALAKRVFSSASERAKLEEILHPKIRAVWQAEVQRWRDANLPVGAVIIPLLFETKAESSFDKIICVACSHATQQERLQARSWGRSEIRQRIEAQWPVEEKINRSDFVIWTDTTLKAHASQLAKILAKV
jgi:dephospho-CoA kinase